MEVCSTTLPQMAIPAVYGDPRYAALKAERCAMFERRSNQVFEYFRDHVPGTIVRPVQGAFYFCVAFEDGVLNDRQTLPISDPAVKAFVEKSVEGVALDKRFVHYMMASEGVCVTPLTGFHTEILGFRLTTLNPDDEKRARTLERIGDAIERYIKS
jgi:aspartate/methionine/tyrosine aminotransferase